MAEGKIIENKCFICDWASMPSGKVTHVITFDFYPEDGYYMSYIFLCENCVSRIKEEDKLISPEGAEDCYAIFRFGFNRMVNNVGFNIGKKSPFYITRETAFNYLSFSIVEELDRLKSLS